MPTKKPTPLIHQLRITRVGIKPPIWRRIQVSSSIPLCCLHDAIQAVMGWSDSHLHQFERAGKYWGNPENYEEEDLDVVEEGRTPLRKVLLVEGDSMVYTYDFGDNWRHEVLLEKIMPSAGVATHPLCLAGERRCPPEDVGGVSGYERFLAVIFDPSHDDFEHYVSWAGGPFHAERFDRNAVNDILLRMRWPIRHRTPRR